ncbi:Dabb family protein [Leekyejoonella antrihumi]|uniref:Dabb family protein n=1 Tax=Leekyejoonella antrihumi TaxID=1660198 RepID=A0A563DPG1_9MICO|nr:Dabb family protein [Leekyejoonella antrihumi]TWP32056.1 Dabb family protein [Leekyejoonella antrihumi]
MIRHVFSWRVADGHSNDEVVELLNTLRDALPVIKYWELGRHQGDPGDNGEPFDGVLINDFDSWDDLESYSKDPIHLDVVARLLPLFATRAVVDFVREDN